MASLRFLGPLAPALGLGPFALSLTAIACNSAGVSELPTEAGPSADEASATVGDGAAIDGSGGPCMLASHQTGGVKLTLQAFWPPQTAITMGMGPVYLWLRFDYHVDSSNKVTGTLHTCQSLTPPVTLSAIAAAATGVPNGTKVWIQFDDSVWESPSQPATTFTGRLGGSNIGSSFSVDPVVSLSGLKQASQWADASVPWPGAASDPMNGSAIPLSDTEDDDGDGKPGVTGFAKADMDAGYFVPRVSLSMTAPQADKLYIVSRTQAALYGLSTSCTEGSGAATVNILNNHVIGCHVGGSDAGPARDCAPVEFNFIDSNTTNYGGPMLPDGTTGPITGTYEMKFLASGTGEGGTVRCADVLAALP